MREWFRRFAKRVSDLTGNSWVFGLAVLMVIAWAATGPLFRFSDTWQLVINTGTTVITFLMVFIIQNTQNRESKSIELKLDELIRATKGAKNNLIDLEDLSDKDIQKLQDYFKAMREKSSGSGSGATHGKNDGSKVRRHDERH